MSRTAKPTTFFTDYAEAAVLDAPDAGVDGSDELVIPNSFEGVSDADLSALHTGAVDAFNALYQGGKASLSDEALSALAVLTEGIERVQSELSTRASANDERLDAATALAARAGLAGTTTATEVTPPAPSEPEVTPPAEIRINLGTLRTRQTTSVPTSPASDAGDLPPANGPLQMSDVVKAAPQLNGYADGQGMTWEEIGKALDRRLVGFNEGAYAAARDAGAHLRSQQGAIIINKPFSEGMVLSSSDPREAERVMAFAADEKRLSGGSLVAAGGWCAPSETIYDLVETETRTGLYDLPTIGVTRGGINHTQGPSFGDLFAAIKGFSYTEAQDIAGNYGVDANGVGNGTAGDKPCYHIDCPDFNEDRLGFDGLCLTAGLLQQRGYPEVIARTTRGALVVHDHLVAGRVLAKVITGSTAVSMTSDQVGATAPILTAIELQVMHYRYIHRLSDNASLEAVFPFWVHGAIRSDLARRLGVDFFDVSNERINQWFRNAGVAPQFIYNFDDLTGAAGSFVQWPTTLRFVLYSAGTWVRGSSDIITLDTLYDSQLLGQNDFTALFTEEGWLVAKRGHDSRVVSVPISTDGATHGGVSIDHDGGQSAVAQV